MSIPNVATSRETKIADRRRRVGEMYLRGRTQWEIGIDLRVSQVTISRDLAVLRKEWLASAVLNFNEVKMKELARIDALEREAWDAYQVSKAERIRRLAEKSKGVDGKEYTRTQQISEESYGDPRLLQQVQWCIEQRLKIYGIYEASKIDLTTGGEKIIVKLVQNAG